LGGNLKARTPATFRQSDVVRAVKAVQGCGLAVVRTEIAPDGRIVLIHADGADRKPDDLFDTWKAGRHAD
jgi:hypothetical protein